jgi:hypothetical protein
VHQSGQDIDLASSVLGAVIAWGISKLLFFFARNNPILIIKLVAPATVSSGLAFGVSVSDEFPLVSYQTLAFNDITAFSKAPSPRYWLLWPGVLIMVVNSLLDVLLTMAPSLFSKLL